MGRLRRILISLFTALAILTTVGAVAAADTGKSISVTGTSNSTLYKAGQTVRIAGTINGDVFCAGQTVTIDATVNGDVICTGQTVTVNGSVNGNVRLAGQTVTLNGTVQKSASIAAQTLTITKSANVGNDAGLLAQSALLDGPVGRDVRGAINDATLNAKVGRNVDLTANTLTIASGADISGNVNYTSKREADKVPAAKVSGNVTRHEPTEHRAGEHGRTFGAWLAGSLAWLAFLLLFSLAVLALFPQAFRNWGVLSRARPWWALLTGFLAMFLFPVLLLALLISIIGLPLGLFLIPVALVVVWLSIPVSAFSLGELVLRRDGHVFLSMLVGILILWLLSLIPIVGGIVLLLAFWFGVGTILMYAWRNYQRPHYADAPVPATTTTRRTRK